MKNRTFGFEFECISKFRHTDIAQNLAGIGIAVDTYATGQVRCRNDCYSGWQVKVDGSISRTDDYPYQVELVSPPLTIDTLGQVRKALEFMHGFARINSSCGLHIHVAVPELPNILSSPMASWRRHVEKTWANVEPVFFSYVTQSRRTGQYCRSGIDWGRKYSALNVSSITSDKGTFEFRLHSATLNYRKAIGFAMLCLSFVDKLVESKGDPIAKIEPELFRPPKPHIVKNTGGEFYVHRTKEEWIIEQNDKTFPFPDLNTALHELRHKLRLKAKTPGYAFHFPEWGSAMTELCGQVKLNGRYRHYLEERYAYMTKRYGFMGSIQNLALQEDDGDFYDEEEFLAPNSVPPSLSTVLG